VQRFLVDTDGGADDAIALMMALNHPDVKVEAITTVADNVSVEQATRNVLYVTELCGCEVPVFRGMAKAILRPPSQVMKLHGQSVFSSDGLGDLDLDPPRAGARPEHAVDAIIRIVLGEPGEISLITLGPLSNVAMALIREPRIAGVLRHVYMMGGAVNALGNVTPSAESNVWADPEAAQVLMQSGAAITLVGWELVLGEMLLSEEEMEHLRSSGSARARFAVDCSRKVVSVVEPMLGRRALPLPDPIAMAVAIEPGICRTEELYVAVETTGELTRGETVVDRWGVLGREPNVEVCFDPDPIRFKRLLFETLL
jgi:purine nucleosidase